MKRRALLLLLPLLALASCGNVTVPPETDLVPYRANLYVGIHGTTYSFTGGGSTLSYRFGADAIVWRGQNVGKVNFGEVAIAMYYITASQDVFYYEIPSAIQGMPGTTEHVHFYLDEHLVRCCYFETAPRIVYKAQ